MGLFDSLFGSSGVGSGQHFTRMDRAQLIRLEKKVDLILKHLGLEYIDTMPPCPLSPEVQALARDPLRKNHDLGAVHAIAFAPDGCTFAVGGEGGVLVCDAE
jgi:hypothetical protein